jgi:predicted outer membrane protein
MSSPIRSVALSCMALVLGVAVATAQQPARREAIRQAVPPGERVQRQPGQIGQPAQIDQQRQFGQQGQQIRQPAQPGRLGQPGQIAQRGQWDPLLVTLLIIDNNKEIALGQLGERTTKNEQVRELCQMIQKDHGNFVQKLQELAATSGTRGARLDSQQSDFAGQPARAGIAERADRAAERAGQPAERAGQADTVIRRDRDLADRQDQDRQRSDRDRNLADTRDGADTATRLTVAKPVIPSGPGSELLLFWQDVAEECVNSARKDAQQQSPEEFDKLFVAGQLLAHKGMLDKLRIAERNASPQLAQVLRDAQGTTKQHLEHAARLHADLGGSSERRDAIRERASERDREGATDRAIERRDRQEQ